MPNNLVMPDPATPRSSMHIEYMRTFDPAREDPWLRLCTHVAAMANSGGGTIFVSGTDELRDELTQRLATHAGRSAPAFEVRTEQTNGARVGVITVPGAVGAPVVFEKAAPEAFPRGSIYFRHGGRSGPATARDIARFVEREVDRERRAVQRNVRKAANAAKGAEVLVVTARNPNVLPTVRVVEDPNAPLVARADFDVTHPYRQKELVATVNERAEGPRITQYDIQCVRRVHHIDAHPEFFHKPKFGSPQYSEAYVTWLLDQYARDPEFFADAKARDRARVLAARQS